MFISYMTLSYKDWELSNSWNGQKVANQNAKIIDFFHLSIFVSVSAKTLMRKNSKEDEQNLEELN